jgi:hypothetical protein
MPAKKPVFGTTKDYRPTPKGGKILCNGNKYDAESDNLVKECTRVAKMNGMKSFVIKMDGHTYNDAKELPTNSIEALVIRPEVVGDTVAEVRTAQDVAA